MEGPVAAQRKRSYDEPHKRMEGWMAGRGDVGLDGDRCTGSSLAGRRDFQAVQEIIVLSRPVCEVNC